MLGYVRPGFQLARAVADAYEAHPNAHGMVWMRHGLVTWGPSARTSYEAMIDLVTRAEEYLARKSTRRSIVAIPGGLETALARVRSVAPVLRGALACHDAVRRIAEKYAHAENFLYLGRQYLFPVALEGALKLKEISYIHAEGYPAAEMKHGPIALVDEDTPSVFLIPRGSVYDKVMSNLEEVRARGGPVIAVTSEGDEDVAALADEVIYVPEVPEYLQPLVTVVPLQLLAYHIALLRGCDVDKPRNLAKSVTVE